MGARGLETQGEVSLGDLGGPEPNLESQGAAQPGNPGGWGAWEPGNLKFPGLGLPGGARDEGYASEEEPGSLGVLGGQEQGEGGKPEEEQSSLGVLSGRQGPRRQGKGGKFWRENSTFPSKNKRQRFGGRQWWEERGTGPGKAGPQGPPSSLHSKPRGGRESGDKADKGETGVLAPRLSPNSAKSVTHQPPTSQQGSAQPITRILSLNIGANTESMAGLKGFLARE